MTAPRPNIRLDPFERAQRDCPPVPESTHWKPVVMGFVFSLPFWALLGWVLW